MNIELWPLLLILIVNSLVSITVFILAFFSKNRSRMFILSWFIFIVPLIGGLYILLGLLFNYLTKKRNVDLSEVSFSREGEKLILPPNKEAEMNYVPIYDAIAVSHRASLRNLLLNTMLSNAKSKISSIAVAINSDDTESSHYAASMIMDLLSDLRRDAQNMIEIVKRLPEDVEMNLITFEFIYDFISLNIMSAVEQEAFVYTLDDLGENLFKYNLWYMTASHYLKLTDLFIYIKDYQRAEKWCQRADKYRPNMLDTYKAKLHLFFNQHNYNAFFQCLKSLKNSDISIDKEIIDLIRTYYG